MAEHIFLRQVLEFIEKRDASDRPPLVNITCRTFNSNNKSGGVLKQYEGVRLLVEKKLSGKKFIVMEHEYRPFRDRKKPNHWENRTRNFETKSQHIRKVKILYITEFNGKEVVY